MKSYKIFGIMLMASALVVTWPLLVLGQEPGQKSAPAGPGTGQEMKESTAPTKSTMQEYKSSFKKEMREFDRKISRLGKKVKKEGDKAGTEAKESWNDLKARQATAKTKLKQLSSKGWEKTRAGADAAREDLRKAYDKTASYFK